jgi:adenosylcobinamide kinase/adenosylcobinamide-phosphate guanylyltransferase
LATAQPFDAEMRERIARHREERGAAFITVEEPLRLTRALSEAEDVDVVLVDCLTLWLSNLLLQGLGTADLERELEEFVAAIKLRRHSTVLVSNEVGMGIVPESHLGRVFRDLAGATHKRLVADADEVYLAAMGLVVRLLPAPVIALRPGELA